MASKHDDGGSIFPSHMESYYRGLTYRELMVAMFITAQIQRDGMEGNPVDDFVTWANEYADEVIKKVRGD